MHNLDLLRELDIYQRKNERVALATVVTRKAPTSGKPGDKAIITHEGEVKGWVGGGCTKGIVIKEALMAIKEESPRLVRIQADADAQELPGIKNYKMTCMSGGSVEVYIEPVMLKTTIEIFGRSHIARALCEVGTAAGFRINVISDYADKEMFPSAEIVLPLKEYQNSGSSESFVVVCTQGEDDEQSLLQAVQTGAPYIGFVASRRKANSVLMGLKRMGMEHDQLVQVKTPAGLDINAKTPHEVAISILAEIIEKKQSMSQEQEVDEEGALTEDLYINPVCKIPIQKSTAKYVIAYGEEKVYFCCDGCKESFEKDPAAYME